MPELIVVDNESTEATRKILTRELDPSEMICSQNNVGYGGGNNLGIRRALDGEAKYILLLNTDAEISEAGVIRLLNRLEADPTLSILGPIIREWQNGILQHLVGGRDISLGLSTRISGDPDTLASVPGYPLHEVDYVSGTVFLARRTVFEQVGLLDEQFFVSGEIADFCKRARGMRHKLCVDLEVSAYHDTSQTSRDLRETLYTYYNLRNRFLYIRKHYPEKKIWYFTFWATICFLEFAKALRWRKPARARAIFLALAHACTKRYGNRNATFM